jgi:hypothetical protein
MAETDCSFIRYDPRHCARNEDNSPTRNMLGSRFVLYNMEKCGPRCSGYRKVLDENAPNHGYDPNDPENCIWMTIPTPLSYDR